MGTETIARTAGRTLGLLLSPARWLERARGRRRAALLALYLVLGAILWWRMSLIHLPDVGDPFDVRAVGRVDIPDDANAFVLYKEASAKIHALSRDDSKSYPLPPSWRLAPPQIRRWAAGNREAMDLFRLGSERPAALYIQPGDMTFATALPVVQDLREFARLGGLEAARLAEAGELAGVLGMVPGRPTVQPSCLGSRCAHPGNGRRCHAQVGKRPGVRLGGRPSRRRRAAAQGPA